jgi:hypothetical protein
VFLGAGGEAEVDLCLGASDHGAHRGIFAARQEDGNQRCRAQATAAVLGFSTMGNSAVSNPFVFRGNEYTFAANRSWIKGSHNFRFRETHFAFKPLFLARIADDRYP